MARTVRDANLQTPAARLRLAARPKPYWRTLEQGLHLGYRRSASGGAWIARRFVGDGRYAETRIGTADDLQSADGVTVRSFAQAQEATRAWWKAELRREAGHGPAGAAYTVADCMRDYEAAFVARGGKGVASVRSIAAGYVIPALGTIECDKLTKARVTAWFNGVVTAGRLKRASKLGQGREATPLDGDDAEAMRKRRSTANRVMVVLRAALNHGHREGKIASDVAWKLVKPFRAVDGVRTRFLQPAEAARLINACAGDFRALVRGALVTGARYGELCRLKVGDVNLRAASIHIRESKSGHPRHVPLSDEGVELFTRLTRGRPAAAHVFTREGAPWKASDQARPMKAACAAANIDPPITIHGMRDTYASNLVMAGASIEVVAQLLGHGDSRITAKHYAHLAPSHVSSVLRASLPRFAAAEPSNVTTLHGADAGAAHGRG